MKASKVVEINPEPTNQMAETNQAAAPIFVDTIQTEEVDMEMIIDREIKSNATEGADVDEVIVKPEDSPKLKA